MRPDLEKGTRRELTVFLDDTVGIGGSVETRHQDEGDVAKAIKGISLVSTCGPLE